MTEIIDDKEKRDIQMVTADFAQALTPVAKRHESVVGVRIYLVIRTGKRRTITTMTQSGHDEAMELLDKHIIRLASGGQPDYVGGPIEVKTTKQ